MSRSPRASISPASHFDLSKACKTRSIHSEEGAAVRVGLLPDRLEELDAGDVSVGEIEKRRRVMKSLAESRQGIRIQPGDLLLRLLIQDFDPGEITIRNRSARPTAGSASARPNRPHPLRARGGSRAPCRPEPCTLLSARRSRRSASAMRSGGDSHARSSSSRA